VLKALAESEDFFSRRKYTGYHLQRHGDFSTKRIFGDGSKPNLPGWRFVLKENLKNLNVIQLPKGRDPADAGSAWSTHMINIGSSRIYIYIYVLMLYDIMMNHQLRKSYV
jgi:hypothetical protein